MLCSVTYAPSSVKKIHFCVTIVAKGRFNIVATDAAVTHTGGYEAEAKQMNGFDGKLMCNLHVNDTEDVVFDA